MMNLKRVKWLGESDDYDERAADMDGYLGLCTRTDSFW